MSSSFKLIDGSVIHCLLDLKSGSNDNQTVVTNVVSGLDSTNPSLSPFNWTCPEVDPYSAIYFYEVCSAELATFLS